MRDGDVVDGLVFVVDGNVGGGVSASSRPSERCLLMWTVTKASRSYRREIGRQSWILPGFGMGVIEKRLAEWGSIRWMRI